MLCITVQIANYAKSWHELAGVIAIFSISANFLHLFANFLLTFASFCWHFWYLFFALFFAFLLSFFEFYLHCCYLFLNFTIPKTRRHISIFCNNHNKKNTMWHCKIHITDSNICKIHIAYSIFCTGLQNPFVQLLVDICFLW